MGSSKRTLRRRMRSLSSTKISQAVRRRTTAAERRRTTAAERKTITVLRMTSPVMRK